MLNYLLTNNLLSSRQFGFLPSKSSLAQLLKCFHDWCANFSQNKSTDIIYSDIQKAFDTVCHKKLIITLQSYGINIILLKWLENYLQNRTQQVCIENVLSSSCPIVSGVPQGSILAPLLFLIFINDIDTCSKPLNETGNLILFADDAKIYGYDPIKLQTSLNSFELWLKNHQLVLAVQKCFLLQISKSRPSSDLTLNNIPISKTNTMKDLGIIISQNLKWTNHINYIYQNARTSTYFIIKFSKCKDISILIKLFKTYARCKLEYNTPLWSPFLIQNIDKLEKIQKDFTRYAFRKCHLPYKSYSDRLSQVNIKSLEYRRLFFDIIFIFKTIHGISGLNFDEFFHFRNKPYKLRGHSLQINANQQYISNNTWKHSFFSRAPKIWNQLPENIVSISSLNRFKHKLKSVDLSKLYKLKYS